MKNSISNATLALVITSALAGAQIPDRCGTMGCLHHMATQDPHLNARMADIESHTQTAGPVQFPAGRLGTVIRIPVVVHVVYSNPSENISNAQIQSQIDVLNEDFRRLNPSAANTPAMFQGVAADTEFEFCMATVDPQGNATSGVTRTATFVTAFNSTSNNVKFTSQGGRDAWPRDQYLNMWVAPLQSGLLGYAQFPGGAANTDGVVVTTTAFGRIGNLAPPSIGGRTATHEVGHWLNLRHIWGDGPCGVDDFVADTPESDAPNFGCQTGTVSCGTVDMVQNYMDYSDDACMNLFTQGQKTRMRALFAPGGFREPLLTSPGCGGGTGGAFYQVNQPRSTLTANGVTTNGSLPAITTTNVGAPVTVAVSSNGAGASYEGLVALAPLVPPTQGGFATAGGQSVNVNLTHPTFAFLFGGAAASLQSFPGNYNVPVALGSAGALSFQMAVTNPGSQDGFALSQGCQVVAAPSSGVTFPAGPTADDGTTQVNLTGAGYSLPVTFYGQTYTRLYVSANGRVTFGQADGNYEATVNGAASGQPFVGFWTDLDPTLGGNINILNPAAGIVRVEWNNVNYWGEPFATVTFAVEFDTQTGRVSLENLNGIQINSRFFNSYSGQNQFLGMSRGAPSAVFGGYTLFSPGGSGSGNTAMIFDFFDWNFFGGLANSIFTGLQGVDFAPTAGGYSWIGY